MKKDRSRYYGHRFPPEIISYAVWVYHRFCLSFRDVEDLLAERGIIVSYEAIRIWCRKFGPDYARKLKRRQGRLGDIWHLDEVFIRINGKQQYLWRAVDQDGDVIDILVQPRRERRATERFFRKLAWTRSESLSRGASPATGCSPPDVENPLLPYVARRDVRLLKTNKRPTSKDGHAVSSST